MHDMRRGDDGWWRAEVEPPSRRTADYGFLLDDDDTALPDPRSPPAAATACTGCRRAFDPAAYAWSDGAWTGRQLAGGGDLRAARRHLHPRGHPRRRRSSRLDHLVDARRRLRRAAAGQRLQRHAQLGLRRRALVRGARAATAARRPTSGSSTPATRAASPSSRTSSTTTSGRAATTCPQFGPVPRRARREHLGRLGQPRRRRTPTRCAATSSTTR